MFVFFEHFEQRVPRDTHTSHCNSAAAGPQFPNVSSATLRPTDIRGKGNTCGGTYPAGQTLRGCGDGYFYCGAGCLFRLDLDPEERHNLANSAEHKSLLVNMQARAKAYQHGTMSTGMVYNAQYLRDGGAGGAPVKTCDTRHGCGWQAQACRTALSKYSGFWGPFVDADKLTGAGPRTCSRDTPCQVNHHAGQRHPGSAGVGTTTSQCPPAAWNARAAGLEAACCVRASHHGGGATGGGHRRRAQDGAVAPLPCTMPGVCTARCKPALLAFHRDCVDFERRLGFNLNRRYTTLLSSCKAQNPSSPPSPPRCTSLLSCADLNWPVEAGGMDHVCASSDHLTDPRKRQCKRAGFKAAEVLCHGAHARLCTAAELKANQAAGTGCGFDTVRVWSQTKVCDLITFLPRVPDWSEIP